ncbi:MAG TPA: VWA domain-containing protein, partial [Gemmatimonadaceae bacterium]|nr:VWA domain-containing protein [Gemmatimonadaceae bacterium]
MGGLGFLAPALLAALAALAVPVVLHLLRRERHHVIEFPSLMFLRRIPVESTSRRRLRHPLLLLLRCAVLALLVAAFARPFLRGRDTILPTPEGAREVVVLLDRSASMTYGDRWPRAVAAAREAVNGLSGDDRMTLVLFDRTATALTEPTKDRDALLKLLDEARPGGGGTRFGPALRLAQGVLETSDRKRREVRLVTDFQRSGWDGAADVRLPEGTLLTRVDLSGTPAGNLAVAGVELSHDAAAGRERATVTARLVNHGDAPVTGRAVTLSLDGRALQTRTVDVPASGGATVRFDPVLLPPEAARGEVRVVADALPADDAFHFVATRAPVRRVLVVSPAGTPASGYLRRALELARHPAWEIVARPMDRLRAADLGDVSLVVLDDVAPPTGETGRAIASFAERGGGVLVALGARSADAGWSGPLAELAPLRLGHVRDRRGGGSLATVDRTHPVFSPFRAAGGGDFAATRVLRYRELTDDDGALRVLARYDDGAVALAERAAGSGRVVVWTGALDNRWSDLPLQPVFVPLVHELARHAAVERPVTPWVTAGARVDVGAYMARLEGTLARSGGAPDAWLVVTPSGERVRVGAAGAAALETREPGFHELRP